MRVVLAQLVGVLGAVPHPAVDLGAVVVVNCRAQTVACRSRRDDRVASGKSSCERSSGYDKVRRAAANLSNFFAV